EGFGAKCLTAGNGLIAIEQVKSLEKIDVILMDVQMPEMDSYEATRAIKAIRPEIPIIALTAHAFEENKVKALEVGMCDFISKPFRKERISQVLANLKQGK